MIFSVHNFAKCLPIFEILSPLDLARREGKGNDKHVIANFLITESSGKRILKIDQHLGKLLTKNVVGLFLTHSAYAHCL